MRAMLGEMVARGGEGAARGTDPTATSPVSAAVVRAPLHRQSVQPARSPGAARGRGRAGEKGRRAIGCGRASSLALALIGRCASLLLPPQPPEHSTHRQAARSSTPALHGSHPRRRSPHRVPPRTGCSPLVRRRHRRRRQPGQAPRWPPGPGPHLQQRLPHARLAAQGRSGAAASLVLLTLFAPSSPPPAAPHHRPPVPALHARQSSRRATATACATRQDHLTDSSPLAPLLPPLATGPRRLAPHQGHRRQGRRLHHPADQGLGPPRSRRRRLPLGPQVVVHEQARLGEGRPPALPRRQRR